MTETLASGKNIRIERIVSRGHATEKDKWYDQEKSEFVILLSGCASLMIESETEPVRMNPGDWLIIPPHCCHRVECTSPEIDTVWLAVFY